MYLCFQYQEKTTTFSFKNFPHTIWNSTTKNYFRIFPFSIQLKNFRLARAFPFIKNIHNRYIHVLHILHVLLCRIHCTYLCRYIYLYTFCLPPGYICLFLIFEWCKFMTKSEYTCNVFKRDCYKTWFLFYRIKYMLFRHESFLKDEQWRQCYDQFVFTTISDLTFETN